MPTRYLIRTLKFAAIVALALGSGQAQAQENYTIHGLNRETLQTHLESELLDRQFEAIPRWRHDVCVDVHGLQPEFTKMIFAHLQNIGTKLGLKLDETCENKQLFVFFTNQSDALAAQIEAANPDLFIGYEASRVYHDSKTLATQHERQEFLKPRAIRWLTASAIRSTDDQPAMAFRSPWGISYAAVKNNASLLDDANRRDMVISIIIVDPDRIKGESWAMLGDLVSLVAFAGPHLQTGYDETSILHFTAGPVLQGPSGEMTAFDRGLLEALYALPDGYDQSDGFDWMADRLWHDQHHS